MLHDARVWSTRILLETRPGVRRREHGNVPITTSFSVTHNTDFRVKSQLRFMFQSELVIKGAVRYYNLQQRVSTLINLFLQCNVL
jgi:hypothetical protein